MKKILAALLLATAATALSAGNAAAQCTARCECQPNGCGCSLNGGNGGSCNASGDGCFVSRCNPDAVVRAEGENGAAETQEPSRAHGVLAEARRAPDAAAWEQVAPGRYVLRSCEDAAEYRRRASSAAMREERVLVI